MPGEHRRTGLTVTALSAVYRRGGVDQVTVEVSSITSTLHHHGREGAVMYIPSGVP